MAGTVNVDTLVVELRGLWEATAHEDVDWNDATAAFNARLSDLAARAREAEAKISRAQDASLQYQAEKESAEADRDRLARRVAELEAALREAEAVLIEISSKPYRAEEATANYFERKRLAALAGDGGGARATICEECGSGILDGEHIADYPCSRSNASEVCAHGCGREATVMKADGRVLCRVCYQAEAGMEGSVPGCPTCGDGGGA